VAVVCAQRIKASTRETQRSAVAQATATGDPRGSEPGAELGVGKVRSSEEASNDRGAKGP
jgi:hypothetical protein